MAEIYDPYHKWLGIPPREQPANDYRLLGIENFESDPDVIASAADQRMAHVRGFQTGRHSALSQKILNEISAARIRLLNSAKKEEYDRDLRERIASANAPTPPNEVHAEMGPVPPHLPSQNPAAAVDFGFTTPPPAQSRRKKRASKNVMLPLMAFLICIGGGIAIWLADQKKDPTNGTANQSDPGPKPPKPAPSNGSAPTNNEKLVSNGSNAVKPSDSGDKAENGSLNSKKQEVEPKRTDILPRRPPATDKEGAASTNQKNTDKKPIPDAKSREPSIALVKEAYGNDIDTSRDFAVAEKIKKKAGECWNNSIYYFVLLEYARDVAARAGEIQFAFKVIEEMDLTFEIDDTLMKWETAADYANSAKMPAEKVGAAEVIFECIQDAIKKDDFYLARKLLEIPCQTAKESGDKGLKNWMSEKRREIVKAASLAAQLEKDPSDPQINLEMGKYLCFSKGDMRKGFTHLARCGEQDLSKLAERELKIGSNGHELEELGDDWLKLSKMKEGCFKKQLQNRAVVCFQRALPGLNPLERVAAEKRLTEIGNDSEASKKKASSPTKSAFYWRKEDRQVNLRKYGGNSKTEKAVTGGLNWLARHQSNDGSWSIENYACPKLTCKSAGTLKNITAAGTALGLLPFLAAGQTHTDKGPYKIQIDKAINWLIKKQPPNGDLSAGGDKQMYSHALAAIALCEAYGMTNDLRIRHSAQAAVQFILDTQNAEGSWRYNFNSTDSDTSVFGWQMMALKSAEMANLKIDQGKVEKALEWLKTVQDQGNNFQNRGRFSYLPRSEFLPSMSAVGLLVTQHFGASKYDPVITDGVQYLMRNLPDTKTHNIYYWYYATQVLHNMNNDDWDDWNRNMCKVLLETQCKTGCAAGSWDPSEFNDRWKEGGRVMATSLSLLCLEIYYRYLPLYSR